LSITVRLSLVASLTLTLLVVFAASGHAGGTWLEFERDSYRPGDVVRGHAEVGPGSQGWVDDGPFHARLRMLDDTGVVSGAEDISLGPVRVEELSAERVAVEVEFVLPDVADGGWYLVVCNEDCVTGLGSLVGGMVTVAGGAPDTLPATGGHLVWLAGVAAALLVLGALVVIVSRLPHRHVT
jgi:hypothetical protein